MNENNVNAATNAPVTPARENAQRAMFGGMTAAELDREYGTHPDPMILMSLLSDAQEVLSQIRCSDPGQVDQVNFIRQQINRVKYLLDQFPHER